VYWYVDAVAAIVKLGLAGNVEPSDEINSFQNVIEDPPLEPVSCMP